MKFLNIFFVIYLLNFASKRYVEGDSFCSRSDCSNHGNCIGTKAIPICLCDINYIGLRCEISLVGGLIDSTISNNDLKVCQSDQCNNKGVCIGSVSKFVCLCYPGFTGKTCSEKSTGTINVDSSGSGLTIPCTSSDCNNNGVCIGSKGAFSCICKLGFIGDRCQTAPYALCDSKQCNNNGLCLGTIDSYICACNLGYSGEKCSTVSENLCDEKDCNNAGICMGTKSNFICLCSIGYSGKRCEIISGTGTLLDTAFCSMKDCNGNGLCFGSKLAPVCLCKLGYQGLRCEIEPQCNSALQCNNNGICIGTATNRICLCNLNYSGTNCQTKLF
ncbi:Eyes shut [Strongyloides ratti]|uniref:Eyes shut n=1 Tax=Strongyloides ratti TaxID=34506 RepID=A0A090LT00_STRRB|nr:Eyes shut [Strongyloides ratti]CEF70699.1 Eyes shut [Strongyloides ratti]